MHDTDDNLRINSSIARLGETLGDLAACQDRLTGELEIATLKLMTFVEDLHSILAEPRSRPAPRRDSHST